MAASNANAEHGSGLRGAEEDGGRTCVLYNVPGLVPYLDGLAWQRALQRERIDHKVAHKGKVPFFLPDALVLLEHPVVYTLGSSSEFSDVLFPVQPQELERVGDSLDVPANGSDEAFTIHRVQRGGKVTYHCPGQIVGYPIVDLSRHAQDIEWYLRTLEQVALCVCVCQCTHAHTHCVCACINIHMHIYRDIKRCLSPLEQVIIDVLAAYGVAAGTEPGLTGVWVDGKKIAAIGVGASRWVTLHGFALNVQARMRGFERIVPCGIQVCAWL